MMFDWLVMFGKKNPAEALGTGHPRAWGARGRGFTLVETAVATVVLGLLLVAAMRVAAAANLSQYKMSERATGRMLADAMAAEVMTLSYESPTGTPLFGRESGELSTSRASYNDVDDYNGFTESTLTDKDGAALAGLSGWVRSVTVEWVSAPALTASSSETGLKRVTIVVKHNGATVATRVLVRCRGN